MTLQRRVAIAGEPSDCLLDKTDCRQGRIDACYRETPFKKEV
jgi:hypothetical protein